MAEEALVESLVADSLEVVRQLDARHDGPTNVVWYLDADAEQWFLLLAGPSLDQHLPRDATRAYRRIAEAVLSAQVNTLTVADVKLIRTDDPLLNATKSVIKTAPTATTRAHYRNNMFNGIFVKEMMVLRAA